MAAQGDAALSLGQQLSLTISRPSALWRQPVRRTVVFGLLIQWGVLFLGKLIALPENMDLDHFARGRPAGPLGFADVVVMLFAAGLTVAAACALWAGLLSLAVQLLGLRTSYLEMLSVSAVALLPFILGRAVGLVLLALWMPLSRAPAELWAWRLWPFSTGLATWLPQPPPALSLGWAFFSVCDLFGLWTLWLTYSAVCARTGMPPRLRLWLGLLLVLLCCAVALGVWQTGQYWLARST